MDAVVWDTCGCLGHMWLFEVHMQVTRHPSACSRVGRLLCRLEAQGPEMGRGLSERQGGGGGGAAVVVVVVVVVIVVAVVVAAAVEAHLGFLAIAA